MIIITDTKKRESENRLTANFRLKSKESMDKKHPKAHIKAAFASGSKRYDYILDEWLCSKQIAVKESTYVRYLRLVNSYIRPKFGSFGVSEIDSKLLESYAHTLLTGKCAQNKTALSPKTVTDILEVIKSTLAYARSEGYDGVRAIGKINIKKATKEIRVFSPKEQSTLVSYLLSNTDRYKAGVLLSLYTGIRIGELCALKWENISLSTRTVKITATMQRIENVDFSCGQRTKIIITEPKSRSSIRTIPLPLCICSVLEKFVNIPEAFFLSGDKDAFCEPRTMQYHFKKYLSNCAIAPAGFHTLRHTFATRCIESGFEIKSLSEILGHSSVNITLNRYVHSSFELKAKNMDLLSF